MSNNASELVLESHDSSNSAHEASSISSNFFQDRSLTSAMESTSVAVLPSDRASSILPDVTIPGADEAPVLPESVQGEQIIAKLPWEHPSSPQDAANHAVTEIRNLGGNPLAYQQAAAWLNDTTNRGSMSASDFKTNAANAFNAQDVHVVGISGIRCSVVAEKVNGNIRVRENDCELQGY